LQLFNSVHELQIPMIGLPLKMSGVTPSARSQLRRANAADPGAWNQIPLLLFFT
jgi:hypothetical protein